MHRGAICQFLFWWIYYCYSRKSTRKKTGKTHFHAMVKYDPWNFFKSLTKNNVKAIKQKYFLNIRIIFLNLSKQLITSANGICLKMLIQYNYSLTTYTSHTLKIPNIPQYLIWYAGLLGRWADLLLNQVSDVPSIYCNILYKNSFN